jgi:hypothetical protein
MNMRHPIAASLLALTAALAGCGGGGGGESSSTSTTTYPPSGAYQWVLKGSGRVDNPNFALSLVHPSQADTEYPIESGSSTDVSDALLVSSGSVNASSQQVTSVTPAFLMYIRGGDVVLLPMQANGNSPASQRISAGSSSACKFVRELAGIDYATPQNSRFIVTTAGADGACDEDGGGDDGRAEVRKDASLGLVLTPISTGSAPLGLVRDPATLAPAGWLYARTLGLWNGSSYSYVTVRTNDQPALQSAVGSTYRQTLAWDGTKLSVIDFSSLTVPVETALDPTVTASIVGWQLIGFDATAFYVYAASTTSFADPWQVLKVSLSAPAATEMAAGTGVVALSSMGNSWLYLTVADQLCSGDSTCTYLVSVNKTDVGQIVTLNPVDGAPNTLIRMEAGANGIDLLSFEPVVESGPSVTTLAFFNDADQSPLASPLGEISSAKSMGLAAASTLNFNSSESRTRFVFATGYTVAQQFNSATLNALETSGASYSPIVLGALPGAADFGSDPSLASVIAGPLAYGSAYVAQVSGGSLQSSGSKVYSFDAGTANSLTLKTKVVN